MPILKSIKLTRCDDSLQPLANPVVVNLCIEGLELSKNNKYSEVGCLLKRTSDKVKSGNEPSGNFTINLTKQSSFIISLMMYGEATSNDLLNVSSWSTDTVMQVGDIVKNANNKQSMVVKRVKGDGRTGSNEPRLTTTENKTIIVEDNNVTWEFVPNLRKAVFEFKDTAPEFIIEYAIEENGNTFYRQFLGVEANKLPLKLEVDDKVPSMQIEVVAKKVIDSEDSNFTSLSSIAGAKEVTLGRDYYSAQSETKKALINGVGESIYSIDLTLDKGIKTNFGLNNTATYNRDIKVDGKISLDFNVDQYNKYKNDEDFSLELSFNASSGCYTKYTFDKVKAEETEPSIKTREEIMLDPNIWVLDDGNLASCEIIYPEFVDSSGAAVSL